MQAYGLHGFWRLGFESCTRFTPFFFSLLFFQIFSKYFCRINSVGNRPAAGSIATAKKLTILCMIAQCTTGIGKGSSQGAIDKIAICSNLVWLSA